MVKRLHRSGVTVACVALAVGAAGCGGTARLRTASVDNGTALTSSGQGSTSTGVVGGSAQGGTTRAGAAATGSGTRSGTASVGGARPGTVSGGTLAAAKGNFASDVGVTKDTIYLGDINMSSATSSLGPAIAEPTEKVISAYIQWTNSHGGVAGRKLKLVTCDDGGDVSRARACYQQLKTKVFAFVPGETWLTDVVHSQLERDKVPWLSWGWFTSEYKDSWMFPCHANGVGEANALSNWLADVIKPKRVGIMYLNVSEDIKAKDEATKVLQQRGIPVVQTIAQEWDSSDESSHVLAMRAANVDFVLSFSWATPVAKFMHDASSQNWAPSLGYAANHLIGDPGYGSIFGDYIKNRVYGVTSWEIPGDPATANSQQMRDYEKVPESYYGDSMLGYHWKYAVGHHITQSGWVCANILSEAIAKLGPDLTREGLKKTLDGQAWGTWMGVPVTFHGFGNTYAFAHEYVYKWMDGGGPGQYALKRITPDPVYRGKVGPGGVPVG
jgi:ABC-type branched-subunit amino acid transport system substrate-binding protein